MTVESVIYAAPFILLSLISAVTCLAIPQLSRYTLQALVAPVAFGLCSIVGMAVMSLGGDVLTKHFQIVISPGPLAEIEDILISLFIYLISGIVGAWLAVYLTNKITQRFRPSP